MNTQGVTTLNYFDLIKNTFGINSNTTIDFQKILSAATQKTESASAEEMLKDIYPDLKYHVADSSGFKYWNRLDFPVHKVYQDTIDVEYLNSWKPTRPTATGFEPDVQANLNTIPRGLHVILIHPTCQERMDKDPEYAKKIVEKVNRYFENDFNTNKALADAADIDYSKDRMSQAVCITENGEIGYHDTTGDGSSIRDTGEEVCECCTNSNLSLIALLIEETATKQIIQAQIAQVLQQKLIYSYMYGLYGSNERSEQHDMPQADQLQVLEV